MDTCYGLQCFCNYYIDEKNLSMSKLEQNIERFHTQSGLDLPTTNKYPPEDVCTAHSNLGSPSAETPFSGDHWLHQLKT